MLRRETRVMLQLQEFGYREMRQRCWLIKIVHYLWAKKYQSVATYEWFFRANFYMHVDKFLI